MPFLNADILINMKLTILFMKKHCNNNKWLLKHLYNMF